MDPTDKIIFICPACQFRARIPAQYIGQTIRCPKCNSAQKVAPPGSDYEASGNTVMISRVAVSEALKPTAPVTTPAASPAPLTPGTDAFSVPGKGPGPIASSTDSGSIESKLLFVCANCNLRARVPARFGGQTIRCPKCQTPGVVPRTQSVEQSTGATVMITRAQLEAPKPSGSGRWRDPSKSRPPTPAAPPAPEPEPVAATPEPAGPAESAAGSIDDLDLGAPLETPPEPLAAAPAPAPAAEIEEDPLAEQPPEPRRPGVVHRRGNSSGSIEVPAKPVPKTGKTGKPATPVKPVKPLKSAPIDPAPAAAAPAAAPKRSPLTLILGILLVVAVLAAAWGWFTAFAAQRDSADLKAQLAAEKAQTTTAEKARSDAESARAAAEQKAMELSAQLAATTATGATSAAPASP